MTALKVAIDDGYAYTKLAWFDERGAISTFAIPSLALSGLQGGVINLDGRAIHAYETEGQTFTVGPFPKAESTDFAEYPVSPLNRVIIHHALVKAGLNDQLIEPGLTLPFDVYYKQVDLRKRRLEALEKPVTCISEDIPLARFTHPRVYPEAAAAWIDAYIDERGEPVRDMNSMGPVAIVDIGGRTTDIAVFLGAGMIDQSRSGTEKLGVLDVLGIIEERIAEANHGIRISRHQAEHALRTGKVHIFKEVDVSSIVREAKDMVVQGLYRVLQRRIERAFELEDILFIGGGAEVMREALVGQADFPQARVLPDPQFANARGVLKYMTYIDEE